MNSFEYCEWVKKEDEKLKKAVAGVQVVEKNSQLVSLKGAQFNLIFEPSIMEDYKYLVREEIIGKIGRISRLLDKLDKRLIIRSAWRSFEHQRRIWENKAQYLMKIHPMESEREINKLVGQFIAQKEKSMHSTGGAVDGLIYDLKTRKVLDFGTNNGLNIDLNEKCFPYHPDISLIAKKNRQLLIGLFEKEGFVCDTKEYWHFDYGNVIWACKKEKPKAFYGIFNRRE